MHAQEGFVEVFCQGAGAHQQLAAQGTHDRRQNGRQQDTGNPRIEQQLGQFDEHAFRVFGHRPGHFRVCREVRDTEETYSHRTGQAQDHPGHGDATRLGDRLDRISVGFGIRTPEQAAAIARLADGVVVGLVLGLSLQNQ